jgi:septation ring formation regulator EzrA
MTPEEILIAFLLSGWEKAVHNSDSLLQVVQLIPDWKSKYDAAQANSLRQQHTQERIDELRNLCSEILKSQGDREELYSLLQSSLARLSKPPN